MPIRDPEKKKATAKAWRERVMPQGYGKWLYARRKLRFEDAENFGALLAEIIEISDREVSQEARLGEISFKAQAALEESRKKVEELGRWEGLQDANRNKGQAHNKDQS